MAGMYIPWVEKPESCLYCPCYDHRWYCAAFQREMTHEQVYVKRPDDCKAIFVPDHGRLGDLDELEQAMRNRKNFVGRLSDPDCLVADAPTLIPASEGDDGRHFVCDWERG